MAELIEVRWDGINYSIYDAIQSYLVEHPEHYYIVPSRQWLCYLTREFGLLKLVHDFTAMDDEEVSAYIFGALETLYGPQA